MQIDLSAKNTHNLSVLKKIDSNVSEIISEASDTAIYRFDAAEKKWERFGFQGAVFVTKNLKPPYHSLIVLNKLGRLKALILFLIFSLRFYLFNIIQFRRIHLQLIHLL